VEVARAGAQRRSHCVDRPHARGGGPVGTTTAAPEICHRRHARRAGAQNRFFAPRGTTPSPPVWGAPCSSPRGSGCQRIVPTHVGVLRTRSACC